MKIVFLTILTSLVFTFGVRSQDFDMLLASNDTTQQVKDIDKICQNIKDNYTNYQLIEVFKDSLSYRHVYLKNNVLQLVKVQFLENKIEKNIDWYFLDEKLVCAESIWINTVTKETVSNTKCYFSNLHMIKWINDNNKLMDSKSPEFKQRETQLVSYSKTLWMNAMKK